MNNKKCKIDIKGINFKAFQELSEDEKIKFVNDVWSWGGKKWKTEQLKKHYFFKTQDNFIIAIENEKYKSISKDLWFDDELPIPEKTKELFIRYNMNLHSTDTDFIKDSTTIFIQNYYKKFENVVAVKAIQSISTLEFEKSQDYYKRELTEQEKQEYIKIIKTINLKYIERLNKYFNKYSKNIYCRGYWVNR